MGGRKRRTNQQIEKDKIVIADYYLKAYTHVQITEKLCEIRNDPLYISRPVVTTTIGKLLNAWKAEQSFLIDKKIFAELEKLDMQENTAWKNYYEAERAWEQSKKALKIQSKTEGKKKKRPMGFNKDGDVQEQEGDGEADEVSQSSLEIITAGDANYQKVMIMWFDRVQRTMVMRAKLLGYEDARVLKDGSLDKGTDSNVPTVINIIASSQMHQGRDLPKSFTSYEVVKDGD